MLLHAARSIDLPADNHAWPVHMPLSGSACAAAPLCPVPALPAQAAHQDALNNVRTAMNETGTLVATVMDTLGPEIVVINR